jgi:hypothetical protein
MDPPRAAREADLAPLAREGRIEAAREESASRRDRNRARDRLNAAQ